MADDEFHTVVVNGQRYVSSKKLERAAFVAQHLFEMIPEQVWKDSGGDDGQGHYEGYYLAEKLREEIKSWTK